jgi:hypothetical protein
MRLNEIVISGTKKLNLSSINLFNKKPMNTDNRVMKRGLSPKYKFTTHNHFEIIDILDKHRLHHKLEKIEFSKMAGLASNHFSNLSMYNSRFSIRSYAKYRDAVNMLSNNNQPKPIYAPTEPTPVINHKFELTEEVCIDFLKSTGKYKISKCEITTNWIEL